MALQKGARRLYDWLRTQKAGATVGSEEVLRVADWSESSLDTYIRKNKIAPFLQRIDGGRLKVLLNGDAISETFFDETFTQTGPRAATLSTGDTLEGSSGATYHLAEPIGQGAVGHVWSAKAANSSSLVAIKIMLPRRDLLQDSKLPNVRERFRREAKNGQTVDHGNIVRYLDMGNVEKNPFLVMELADRSVADQIRQNGHIPEEEAAGIVQCCAVALRHLHERGCPHRDVKPANILEFSSTVKLGDLGIVRWSDFDTAFTHGGTITRQSVQLGSWFYMAPEQQESPHDALVASDVYALGVSWIEMLTGAVPAPHAIGARMYKIPALRHGIESLIARMVAYSPDQRPDLNELIETIERAYP